MRRIYNYSIKLHFATACCFLLPFFYTGCEEGATAPSTNTDPLALVDTLEVSTLQSTDTTKQFVGLQSDSLNNQTDSISNTTNNNNISSKIGGKIPFLSPFLMSKPNTYSGIAATIDSIPFFSYYSIFISFLFIIIGLIIKYMESNSRKTIFLIDFIALFSLAFSSAIEVHSENLWGYWIAFVFLTSLTIYDLYILKVFLKTNTDARGISQ